MRKLKTVGRGEYGIVYAAEKEKTQERLVVKRNLIDCTTDGVGSIKEYDILDRLDGHPFIISLRSVKVGNPFTQGCLSPVRDRRLKDDRIHFTFEQALYDGHTYIYDQPVNFNQLSLFMVQLLLAVEYTHAKAVIHRDIKPANTLIFKEPSGELCIKLCDYGLAKSYSQRGPQSPRVVTLWYRAPEIAFHHPTYTQKSDLWSIGCLFFEMVARRPLFGGLGDRDDYNLPHVLALLDVVPKPPDLKKLGLRSTEYPVNPLRKSWAQRINLQPDEVHAFGKERYEGFLELLGHLLELDPEERWSATRALEHPFFQPWAELIAATRQKCPPVPRISVNITIQAGPAREAAFTWVRYIYHQRANYPWYKHRSIFYAIDIFDRYQAWTEQNKADPPTQPGNYGYELQFMVCLYMAYKYFISVDQMYRYTDLVAEPYKTPEALKFVEEFEMFLLMQVLQPIYRDTIFEAADRDLRDDEIGKLLEFYGKLPSQRDTPLAQLWTAFEASTK